MENFVRVQILRSIKIGSQTHREPSGWFRYERGGEFRRKIEIFIRYLQMHLKNRTCCKNSNSQLVIIFRDEEDQENQNEELLTNWITNVLKQEPEQGDFPNIHFPRIWREYNKEVGRCFCCGFVLEEGEGCYYCFLDRIILEEAIHFPNAWNNWGNLKFISNPLPGLHPNPIFGSGFELLFIMFCEPMQRVQQNVNRANRKVKTGENMWTWENLTTPLHYITAQRFFECEEQKTRTVPELFALCRRNIFLILQNYKRLSRINELPLPKTLLSDMKILLPAAFNTSSERPRARLCAEDCCSDGRKICPRAMPNTIKYSHLKMKVIGTPSR